MMTPLSQFVCAQKERLHQCLHKCRYGIIAQGCDAAFITSTVPGTITKELCCSPRWFVKPLETKSFWFGCASSIFAQNQRFHHEIITYVDKSMYINIVYVRCTIQIGVQHADCKRMILTTVAADCLTSCSN